jgi:general secretion pathway protein N
MKISWRLLVFGVIAYALFLAFTLPAAFMLSRLQKQGVMATGVSGSIWQGQAAALQINRLTLGHIDWDVRMLHLFIGKLSVDVRAKRDEGTLQGNINIGFGKVVEINQLKGSLPISALGGLGLPGGWQGAVQLNLATLQLESYWPIGARGTVSAMNLVGPANQPMSIGDFRVEFDGSTTKEGIIGTLTSAGNGPFDANGTLRLQPNRSYLIDAQVAMRPGAPQQIANALQYLGPPDAQGRRALSMAGSL